MKPCTYLICYSLLLFIFISSIAALVVLGLDLDLLLNGPDYLSKVITNIVNRFHEEEIVNEEQLQDVLLDARQSLWVHIPMVMVVVLSILLLLLNSLGCAGACLLSYSLLSGFTMFMFVSFILYACLALWIFANNMEDSVMDSFMTEKISQYNQSESIFNLVIDTVQRDLQCCGFKSSADWIGSFPSSCCLEEEFECGVENIYRSSCLEMIRSSLLQPSSMVGVIGVTFLVVVAMVGVTTALSLCLCLTARSHRGKKWSLRNNNNENENVDESYLELTQPRFLRK